MMLIWTLATALAAGDGDRPAHAAGDLVTADVQVASVRARLDEAWIRVDQGDHEGALLLADDVARRTEDPDLLVETRYLGAVSLQLRAEHDEALAAFAALLDTLPADHPRTDDVRFRVALVEAQAGRPRDALRALRRLGPTRRFDEAAARKIAFAEATWLVEAGRTRRGVRKLADAFATTLPQELTWFQARARWALAHDRVAAAADLDFDRPDKRQGRHLKDRVALLREAEAQVSALAELPEPWFVVDGVRALGEAWEALGDDLQQARPPRKLSDAQEALFIAETARSAASPWTQGARYYRMGLDHAEQVGVDGLAPALAADLARVSGKLETLPPAEGTAGPRAAPPAAASAR